MDRVIDAASRQLDRDLSIDEQRGHESDLRRARAGSGDRIAASTHCSTDSGVHADAAPGTDRHAQAWRDRTAWNLPDAFRDDGDRTR
jgi:hypothetical protein